MSYLIETEESQIVAPTVEPLDLALVKLQRRFSAATLDSLFAIWIAAARQHYEEQTGSQLITATREYWLDAFPWDRQIELPRPPLQSVESIEFLASDGTYQEFLDETSSPTITPYEVIAPEGDPARRGSIVLLPGYSWPVVTCQPRAVKIRFVCGFGDTATEVPALVRHALLMLVGHFHKFGEEVQAAVNTIVQVPMAAQLIIDARKYAALPQHRPTRWPINGAGTASQGGIWV